METNVVNTKLDDSVLLPNKPWELLRRYVSNPDPIKAVIIDNWRWNVSCNGT